MYTIQFDQGPNFEKLSSRKYCLTKVSAKQKLRGHQQAIPFLYLNYILLLSLAGVWYYASKDDSFSTLI